MSTAQNYQAISRRPPDVEDYIDMMRRYRSYIVAPMFAGLVIAVVAAFLHADTFVSSAVMRITPPQVPEQLVPSVNYTQISERLQQMQTEILSRNVLTDIITKPSLDLYKRDRSRIPMEDIIQEMKNRYIRLTPITGTDRRMARAFQISFYYTDRYKAQLVVRELVSRFTEQNLTVQQDRAKLTTTFLSDEVKSAKEKMDDLDNRITRFKMQNQGRLPEQTQANTQAMFQLQMQAMSMAQNINRDTQEKVMLESDLQNLRNTQNYYQGNLEQLLPGQQSYAVKNEKIIDLNKKIAEGRSQLAALQNIYGPNYPEISTLKAAVADLEKQASELEAEDARQPATTSSVAPRRVVNAQVEKQLQELHAQIASTQAKILAKQTEIESFTRQRAELDKQVAVYQKRIDEAPLSEQQYAALLSEFNMAKATYQEMVKKHEMSETAKNLEDRKAGETLETLDPPNLPEKPIEPNRWAWAGVGTIGGLICGLALAALKEVKDASLKNLKDVRAYTNLPVLSSIPLLENALLLRRKRRLVWLAWSSALIVGCMLMAGSMYYYVSGSI
jgi:polysaccharide biosynthesis transport protein